MIGFSTELGPNGFAQLRKFLIPPANDFPHSTRQLATPGWARGDGGRKLNIADPI